MKCTTLSALFFAASIAIAIAVPARNYYYDDEYPEGSHLVAGRPISLANAPFYYQSRHLELEDIPQRGRKYQIVKRKKQPGAPQGGSDEDAEDDDSGESSEEDEEEDDENAGEDNEEESADVPPWEDLFPEDDKNTGSFQDQPSSGYGGGQGGPSSEYGGGSGGPSQGYGGGQGGPSQGYGGGQGGPGDMQGGHPAPSSGGSLLSLLTGGNHKPQNEGPGGYGGQGGPGGYGGQGGPGGPQGGPGGPQFRHALLPSEEPRSGAAVLYSPYTDRYIPVRPVQVRIPKRQAKKVKKVTPQIPEEKFQGRSLRPASSSPVRKSKKTTGNKKQYVLVPVDRDSREIRFDRNRHNYRVESAPVVAPTQIWRWEGRGGGQPSGLYYAPRPHRGSASSIRFAPQNDY